MASAADQKARVFAHLKHLEGIDAVTQAAIADNKVTEVEPLADIDPDVYAEAEDAFYAERGKQRYITRNGRTRWLTAEEIVDRQNRRKKNKARSRYYGPASMQDQRELVRWAFIVGSVVAGLLIVWVVVL